MLPVLTCLAALTVGPAPEAEPLYVEVTFFEQQLPARDADEPSAPQAKFFVSLGDRPSGNTVVATMAARVEIGKLFMAQTRVQEHVFRITGTVQAIQHGKYSVEVETSRSVLTADGKTEGRIHSSVELARNEQMTLGGLTQTSVSVIADGFFGMHTRREETSVSQGFTIRLTREPPNFGTLPKAAAPVGKP